MHNRNKPKISVNCKPMLLLWYCWWVTTNKLCSFTDRSYSEKIDEENWETGKYSFVWKTDTETDVAVN